MKKFQIFNLIIIILGVLISLSASVYYFLGENKDTTRAIFGLLIPFIYFIPLLIKKIFKVELDPAVLFIILLHILFSASIGSAWNAYSFINHYDSVMHFAFGFVGCVLGLIILSFYKNLQDEKVSFIVVFTFLFSMTCAACWEIYEFIGDIVINGTAQGDNILVGSIYITDVTDTMKDIICNFVGAIIFDIIYFLDFNYKKVFLGNVNKAYTII